MNLDLVLENRSHLYGVMRACKLSNAQIGPIINMMVRIEQTRGTAELVKYLKARLMALVKGTSSFRTHSDGTWAGVFRPVSRLAKLNRKGFKRACRICKVYHIFMAPEPSRDDYVQAANKLAIPEPGIKQFCYAPYFVRRSAEIQSFDCWYPAGTSKMPLTNGKAVYKVTPREHVECLFYFPEIAYRHYTFFSDLIGLELMPSIGELKLYAQQRRDIVGSYTLLTKDGGLKLRGVANSFPILNLALSRLHNTLYSVLRTLDNCFVFNQKGGVDWCQQQLMKGRKLTSIDLDAATDNIPLEAQLVFVTQLLPELYEDIEIFREAARAQFLTKFEDVVVSWRRGQPMGLKASFPLFTLFLWSLISKITDQFAIVGDDIVVDSEYGEDVLQELEKFSIPISEGKSLFNSHLAEFCGCIIDKHGSLGVYKARLYNQLRDPLGLYRQYGIRAFRFMYRDTKEARVKQIYDFKIIDELGDDQKEEFLKFLPTRAQLRVLGVRSSPPKGGPPSRVMKDVIDGLSPSERMLWKELTASGSIEELTFQEKIDQGRRRYGLSFPLIKKWAFPELRQHELDEFDAIVHASLSVQDIKAYLDNTRYYPTVDFSTLDAVKLQESYAKRQYKYTVEGILPFHYFVSFQKLINRALTNKKNNVLFDRPPLYGLEDGRLVLLSDSTFPDASFAESLLTSSFMWKASS